MKDNETRTKFIELRAQGVSLRKIAEELKISPGTACDWAARYKKKIKNLKMLEMEAIQERYLAKYEEELEDLMEEFRRIKAELSNRSFEYLSTPFLLQHKGTLLSRMDKKRTRAEFEETGDE